MPDIKHHFVETNGIKLHVAEMGQGPLVLMAHGFPESWRSWRFQMQALAAAGYRVAAPDQRGYGQSDKPEAIEAYNIFQLAGDLIGLVKALGETSAVIVGHDWGSPATWHAAQLRPDVFKAVCLLSVPFTVIRDGSPVPPTQLMRSAGKENEIFYQLFYQEPGAAESIYEADVQSILKAGFYTLSGEATPEERYQTIFIPTDGSAPDPSSFPLPKWLSEEELDFYTQEFTKAGFRGSLNWYRNIDYNWENTGFLSGSQLVQPLLFMAGEVDPVLDMYPGTYDNLEVSCPNLWKKELLPGVGHWIQQEAPEQVNEELLNFLASLDDSSIG